MAPSYTAVVTLHLPAERLRGRFGDTPDAVEPIDENRCRVRSDTDTLEWLASRLILLDCEFEVHEPPELIEHLRALSTRIARAAAGSGGHHSNPCDQGQSSSA
jgi:predicted DNA-binding transcriptional regulator YafY